MKHTDALNVVSVRILAELYERFPAPIEINAVKFKETLTDLPSESRWKDDRDINLIPCTIRLLARNGMVQFALEHEGVFTGVSLTASGVTLLTQEVLLMTRPRLGHS